MSTLDDIDAEQQAQLDILNTQLMAAAAQANQGVAGMAAKVAALRAQRDALETQNYEGAMNGPAMAQALATLKSATASMRAAAAQMTSATAFVTHVDDLIGGAMKAEAALKAG
jgi:hypothetical protein